jgi:cAMP-dependent protein kinase regulator
MYLVPIKKGVDAITEGELGTNFYVVESGLFDVYQNDEIDGQPDLVGSRGPGTCFGELALMYNSPRSATVTAVLGSTVWCVDRYTYRRIVANVGAQKLAR